MSRMSREEAKIFLCSIAGDLGFTDIENYTCKDGEKMREAIKILEQEPCEDAISRQAELDGIASIAKAKAKSDAQKSLMGRVMFFTEHLPPVTPKPKTGHWIHFAQSDDCSLCGYSTGKYGSPSKYCPNCGAKMEGCEDERSCML